MKTDLEKDIREVKTDLKADIKGISTLLIEVSGKIDKLAGGEDQKNLIKENNFSLGSIVSPVVSAVAGAVVGSLISWYILRKNASKEKKLGVSSLKE